MYYMTYCLTCGSHSDPDIGIEDVYDWNREHGDDVHPDIEWAKLQFHYLTDGTEHVIRSLSTVGGFTVGDQVKRVDENARWAAEGKPEVNTITGFDILGYQGIIALFGPDDGEYLDYIARI